MGLGRRGGGRGGSGPGRREYPGCAASNWGGGGSFASSLGVVLESEEGAFGPGERESRLTPAASRERRDLVLGVQWCIGHLDKWQRENRSWPESREKGYREYGCFQKGNWTI